MTPNTLSILHYVSYALPIQAGNTLRTHQIALEQRRMGYRVAVCECIQPRSWRGEVAAHESIVYRDGVPYFYYVPSNLSWHLVRSCLRWLSGKRVPGATLVKRKIDLFPYAKWVIANWTSPTIIHAHSSPEMGMEGLRLARHFGACAVYEVRGFGMLSDAANAGRRMTAAESATKDVRVAMRADKVFVIGEGMRRLLAHAGVPLDKIIYTPNGVDVDTYCPRHRDLNLAAKLDLAGRTVFGYVTNVRRLEGIQVVVDAWARVSAAVPDAVFLLVGDGAYLADVKRRADQLNVTGSWRFAGCVPHCDVRAYYSLMDVFVVPRIPEPVCNIVPPLKPLEAMAMGVPLVVSDVEALREIVTDGETGLVFRAGDPEALAAALIRIGIDAALRKVLAEKARSWVAKYRRWSVVSEPYAQVYPELLGHSGNLNGAS